MADDSKYKSDLEQALVTICGEFSTDINNSLTSVLNCVYFLYHEREKVPEEMRGHIELAYNQFQRFLDSKGNVSNEFKNISHKYPDLAKKVEEYIRNKNGIVEKKDEV